MKRKLVVAGCLIAVAGSAWIALASPAGPSTAGGKNPLVTLHQQFEYSVMTGVFAEKQVYEVPQGYTLVVQSLLARDAPRESDGTWGKVDTSDCGLATGGNLLACARRDGVSLLCGTTPESLAGGVTFPSGAKVTLLLRANAGKTNGACVVTVSIVGGLERN